MTSPSPIVHRAPLVALLAACASLSAVPSRSQALALEPLGTYAVPGGVSQALAFSPAGDLLASGGELGEVLWIDVASRRVIGTLETGPHWVGAIAFSPDGHAVAAKGRDLVVHETATRALVFSSPETGPKGLAYSPDGRFLAYGKEGGVVRVVETAHYAEIRVFERAQRKPVNVLAFTADGRSVLAGCNERGLWRLDVETGVEEVIREFAPAGPRARSTWVVAAASLRGGVLAAASWDAEVHLGDRRYAHPARIFAHAASRDGERFAVGGKDGHLSVFGLDASIAPLSLKLEGTQVAALAFDSCGRLAVSGYDGRVRLDHLGASCTFEPHPSTAASAAFTPDERFLVVSGKRVRAFDLSTRAEIEIESSDPCFASEGRSGSEVLLCDREGLRILDLAEGEVRARLVLDKPQTPRAAAWAPDRKRLALGGADFAPSLLVDLEDGSQRELGRGFLEGPGIALAWNRSGDRLALGTVLGNHAESGGLVLFAATGAELARRSTSGPVPSLAFDPEGDLIWWHARSYAGGLVAPQRVRSRGDDLAELESDSGELDRIAFLANGRAFACGASSLTLVDSTTLAPKASAPFAKGRRSLLSPSGALLAVIGERDVRVLRVRVQD